MIIFKIKSLALIVKLKIHSNNLEIEKVQIKKIITEFYKTLGEIFRCFEINKLNRLT